MPFRLMTATHFTGHKIAPAATWINVNDYHAGPVLEFGKPTWAEVASVAGLAVRLDRLLVPPG